MSFRIEEKIPLSKSDGFEALSILFDKGFRELYPERSIKSIYFDTKNYALFDDSEEGVLPRKKIRIRCYPEDLIQSSSLEKKFSSIEGRFKEVLKLEENQVNSYLSNGYLDSLYGLLIPCCKIKYTRKYFIKSNIRVTFDQDISYRSVDSNLYGSIAENRCVLEVKAAANESKKLINNLVPFPRSRFSKFSEAIKSLNKC